MDRNRVNEANGRADGVSRDVLMKLSEGSHEAFELVFVTYFKKIKYFINGLIKSEEDAEELTQDIFVKLWTNREMINPDRSFGFFMYTMARNATFNFLKHKVVRDTYVSERVKDEEVVSTEDVIYAREINLLISMAVSRMPEQRKKIYEMSRYAGLPNDEIASRLNLTKKTVENQLSLALKDLRKIVMLFLLFV